MIKQYFGTKYKEDLVLRKCKLKYSKENACLKMFYYYTRLFYLLSNMNVAS